MCVCVCMCVRVCQASPQTARQGGFVVSCLVRHVQFSEHRPDFGFDAFLWDSCDQRERGVWSTIGLKRISPWTDGRERCLLYMDSSRRVKLREILGFD